MKLEKTVRKIYNPRIVHSGALEKKFVGRKKINLDVMDFGDTRVEEIGITGRRNYFVGTHKGIKAEHALDYVDYSGRNYALLITSGNAGKAFDIEGKYHPNLQVVKFMNKGKLVDVNVGETGRADISIRLPNKWMNADKKELEKFWKRLIAGRNFGIIRKYRKSADFEELASFVDEAGDYESAVDVTNIDDYISKDEKYPYLISQIKDAVKYYDCIIAPIGIGELAFGLVKARENLRGLIKGKLFNKPAKLLFVTGKANPFAFKSNSKSDACMLDTPKPGKAHWKLRKEGVYDRGIYFCSLDDEKINIANGRLNALVEQGLNMKTSSTGSMCFGVFNDVKSQKGNIVIPAYRFREDLMKSFNGVSTKKDYVINPRDRVCVVNTGGSR